MTIAYTLDRKLIDALKPFLARIGFQPSDILREIIEPWLETLNLEKDNKLHGFKDSLKSIIIKKLQQQEDNLIENISFKVSSITTDNIDLFIEEVSKQADCYAKEKLLAQAELFKILSRKQIDYPFDDLWKLVIDGKDHHLGAYAFEDETGYIVAALNAFAFAHKQPKKIVADDIEKLHAHAVSNVYKIRCEFLIFYQDASIIKSDIKITPVDRVGLFGFYQLEDIDVDDYRCAESEANIRKPWSSLVPKKYPKLLNKNKAVESYNVKIEYVISTDYLSRLDNIVASFHQLIEKSENGIDRLLACIYLFREITIHHFFSDGNLRTSLINFNSLLIRNGFQFVIFENPNHHDFHMPYKFAKTVINAMVNISDEFRCNALELISKHFKGKEKISWQEWQGAMCKEKNLEEKIHQAIKDDNIYFFEMLQSHYNLNTNDYLHLFLSQNAVHLLAENKKELEKIIQTDQEKWFSLFTEAVTDSKFKKILSLFIELDSEKKFINSTALNLAIERQNETAVNLLIKYDFNKNTGETIKNTFLHAACNFNNFKNIALIFNKYPLDIVKENENGNVPIDLLFNRWHREPSDNDITAFFNLILKKAICIDELKRNSDKLISFFIFSTKDRGLFNFILEKGLLNADKDIYKKIIFSVISENKIEDFVFQLNNTISKFKFHFLMKNMQIIEEHITTGELRSNLYDCGGNFSHAKDIIAYYENDFDRLNTRLKSLFISAFNKTMEPQQNNNSQSSSFISTFFAKSQIPTGHSFHKSNKIVLNDPLQRNVK